LGGGLGGDGGGVGDPPRICGATIGLPPVLDAAMSAAGLVSGDAQ
jgi:hypothetical protein